MNQIVITRKSTDSFKVLVMGEGRTEEMYVMKEKIILDNLSLLLKKLKETNGI